MLLHVLPNEHAHKREVPAARSHACERVIDHGMQAQSEESDRPYGTNRGPDSPKNEGDHEAGEWYAAFRGPFQIIVVSLVHPSPVVVESEHLVHGDISAQSPTGQGPSLNHGKRCFVDFAPCGKLVGALQFVQHRFEAGDINEAQAQ